MISLISILFWLRKGERTAREGCIMSICITTIFATHVLEWDLCGGVEFWRDRVGGGGQRACHILGTQLSCLPLPYSLSDLHPLSRPPILHSSARTLLTSLHPCIRDDNKTSSRQTVAESWGVLRLPRVVSVVCVQVTGSLLTSLPNSLTRAAVAVPSVTLPFLRLLCSRRP